MVEPEVAPGGLEDALALCQGAVAAAAEAVLRESKEDLEVLGGGGEGGVGLSRRLSSAAAGNFPRITYTQALEMLTLQTGGFQTPPPSWGGDLGSEHERWLAEVAFGGRPVFVTHYPKILKPFYMRETRGGQQLDDDKLSATGDHTGTTVENFDLLVPHLGELAGGSAREEDFRRLSANMWEKGLLSKEYMQPTSSDPSYMASRPPADPSNGSLDWYLDLRRYGSVPSAGWGLGFERLVAWATALDNVRDAIPCPRARNLCAM